MPDVYATITEAERSVLDSLADVIEVRAADPQQQAIRAAYLSQIDFPTDARVLEVGCGPGPVARALAVWPGVGEVVGLDPSPRFLELARELAGDIRNLTFVEGDARCSLPLDDATFDVVVFHTALCHIPGPERRARRSLPRPAPERLRSRSSTATTRRRPAPSATPTRSSRASMRPCAFLVHDRWIVRRLVKLVEEAGFDGVTLRSHGYVEAPSLGYMLALVDRGADILSNSGRIGADTPTP